jgi:general secretion pathway protein H
LRDSAQSRLETEAVRLAALLEAARAQSRTLGVAVQWQPKGNGFSWPGLSTTGENSLPTAWLDPATRTGSDALLLGPEPIIAPASIILVLATAPDKPVRIATDGVRPFAIQAVPERAP